MSNHITVKVPALISESGTDLYFVVSTFVTPSQAIARTADASEADAIATALG